MNQYELEYSSDFKEDVERLKKAGELKALQKIAALLNCIN